VKKRTRIKGCIKSAPQISLILFLILFGLTISTENAQSVENAHMVTQQKKYSIGCAPTPPDAMGPFYKPKAPVRNSVGSVLFRAKSLLFPEPHSGFYRQAEMMCRPGE
jgi:hypothetical protein